MTTLKETAQAYDKSEDLQSAAIDYTEETRKNNFRLIIPQSTNFSEVAEFKTYLKEDTNLKIIMSGGSTDEGSIIIVSTESQNIFPVLNEIPLVESARRKGEDIQVKLKTLPLWE